MTVPFGALIGLLAGALLPATAGAQFAALAAKESFAVTGAFERNAAVVGELRIPQSQRERLPAVVIVNSSPGFDGRSAFYAEALNQAGIATFEIDMLQGRGVPRSHRDNMPHVFQALRYLDRHPRIDAARVGVMGFSWGAVVALLASSDALARQYGGDGRRYAAHLALYPQCWHLRAVLAGKASAMRPEVLAAATGAPVRILAGDQDKYDDADGCVKLVAQLPDRVRPHYAVTVYEGATFAWDNRFSYTSYEAGGNQGRGSMVNVVADPVFAERSRAYAVEYFRKQLAAE